MLWNKLKQARQSLQEMGIYGVLMILQKGIGLMMLPVTTRYLSLQEYGVLESLVVIFSLCSLLEISAGALPRFYPECKDAAAKANLISSSVLLSLSYGLVLAVLAGTALALAPLEVFSQLSLIQLAGVSAVIALSISLQPIMMWLRIERRADSYFYLVVAQASCQVVMTLFGLQQGWGMDAVIVASVCANALGLSIGLWFCRKQLKLKLDLALAKLTLSYQRCLIGASLALFIMHGLDRLLLAEWLGAETLAQYAIMIKVVEATAMAFGVLESWWLPRRFTVLQQSNGVNEVSVIHQRLLLAVMLLILSAALFAPIVLKWVLPIEYLGGIEWLPLMLLALGFKLATAVTDIGCYLPNSPVWLPRINALSALMAIGLYYLLIPKWGVWGLIVATNSVFALRFILFTALSLRLQALPYKVAVLLSALLPPLGLLLIVPFMAASIWTSLLPAIGLSWLLVWAMPLVKPKMHFKKAYA
ncbi:lipopolysaccharide biosynthesis protein [Agarivorans albus]|uniref:Oligosaccharide translocase n=1 Tax=Agarivorans albus MKT 106 TaxID=1331007 RepID=R9PHA6_AGAAL|nr:oligosaccharide flippase family protein [Agarivorans albus]GAD00769.1 oligosaccharide translocase [Agarivorans albus MKT 106]